ncbi:MAG: hypothetical protein WA667_01180 [Candidatus Nitrosopolaris sp.]
MTNYRLPVRIEILSSAEIVSSLDSDLREILLDASDSCEYTAYVDKDGGVVYNLLSNAGVVA